ncbi:coiled-coil domain-containing protein [Paraliomyxa miuraensis]|uniref:hypothetical protein n=1 Tax=Paraliomyxa miuraensis TaxID=376150 RepID=UPI00225378E9|nr:hypothetical protein [Paraliomyxa miuraensis]MCX4242285.1 hypothetical protein [Paraliomyxa miuraensis]
MKTVTNKSTKTEILSAYNSAMRELKALRAQQSADPKPMKALPPAPGEAPAGGELSIADIITRLRGLTTNIGESASALQGNLTAEATTLTSLRDRASAVTSELQALHGIDVGDDTLAELVARYTERKDATDKELTERKDATDKELMAARAEWKAEQDAQARKAKETARELEKARKRDLAEYDYGLARAKEQHTDEQEQARKQFEQELSELRERKASEWKAREQQLAKREQEYAELRAKDETWTSERDTAAKKAEAEGMAIARRQTKAQSDLLTKDHEGARRVLELKVDSLEQTIAKQEAQIAELSRQLEGARKQTTELAMKAIDGASNASSFEAIKEIALEQAKNSPKSK